MTLYGPSAPGCLSWPRVAQRDEPRFNVLIRSSMAEWRFGSDRPAFPQVHHEAAPELGMVVAARAFRVSDSAAARSDCE